MKPPEVAIIGGGVAGLVAAIEVARCGGTATVFEATTKLGGRAQTRELDGFSLNQGPHALYRAGALFAALQDFGVTVTGNGPDLPNGWAIWDGDAYPFPLRQAGRNPDPLDSADAEALSAFFARMVTAGDFGSGAPLQDVLMELPRRAGMVVAALVRLSTYVDAPDEIDGKAALDQLRLSFAGTLYVDGGWRRIVDGLAVAADQAGVTIQTRSRISSVTREPAGAIMLRTRDGGDHAFAAAILAVPPGGAVKMVAGSSKLRTAVASTRPIRLMSLDLALSRLPDSAVKFALGFDRPTYLSVHSAAAELAPAGGALMHVARYLRPGDQVDTDLFADVEQMADRLQPGWRGAVVHEQKLTGATVAHDFPRSERRGERAQVIIPDCPGIFLAGDWVGETGMLADAAAASARHAARSACAFAATVTT